MGIKPGLQARAGVECRARPTDAAITLPRGSAPFLHHHRDYQAIKSACLFDPVLKVRHTILDLCYPQRTESTNSDKQEVGAHEQETRPTPIKLSPRAGMLRVPPPGLADTID